VETLSCFCDGQSWTCAQAAQTPCELQTCPPPYAVFPGESCVAVGGPQGTCTSSNVPYTGCGTQGPSTTTGTCTCSTSGWSCSAPEPACVVGPPAVCPSPYAITEYGSCSAIGMTCPANPRDCEGQTYFDTYKCQTQLSGDIVIGDWVPVATTTCDISEDSGVAYPSFDGAVGYALDSIKKDTN
jgi:hypothetical protein